MSLGALNACSLATNFAAAGFEVVITDVVTPATATVYRQALPACLIVHLRIHIEGERAGGHPAQVPQRR